MSRIQTILHPTDFSEHSEWAFRLACSLARDQGARLVALHVAPPSVYGLALAQQEEYEKLWNDLRQLQAADFKVQLEHQLRQGDPANEILRVAQEIPCDLIVLGMHGRTGLGRLLMGSVAEQLVRRAPCPVLTIKAPFPEAVSAPKAQAHEAAKS